jgi:hypothetical protein
MVAGAVKLPEIVTGYIERRLQVLNSRIVYLVKMLKLMCSERSRIFGACLLTARQ